MRIVLPDGAVVTTYDRTTATCRSVADKMPTFYVLMLVSLVGEMIVFWGEVPWWIGPLPIGLYFSYALYRLLWWRRHRTDDLTADEARARISQLSLRLFQAASLWACLDVYFFLVSDRERRYFVLIEMAISSLSACYFLMGLRMGAARLAFVGGVSSTVCLLCVHTFSSFLSITTVILSAGGAVYILLVHTREMRADIDKAVAARVQARRLNEENLRIARLDMVTGLENRRQFFEALTASLKACVDGGVTLGLIDLDGFKSVNDTHGHRAGDQVLRTAGERIAAALPRAATLFRTGGDEFAFLIEPAPDDATLARFGQAVIDAVCEPIGIGDMTTSVGCSIGFARAPRDADNGEVLFEYADFALYQAKHEGRGRCVIFEPEHARRMHDRSRIENVLRAAAVEAEFFPVFQPIVDCETGRTLAFESLARWNSPVLGNVSPGDFIPIAERTGLISRLSVVLLRKTLECMRRWPVAVAVSFNLSPHDLGNRDVMAEILDIVARSGIAPQRIGFELTETALLQNFAEARRSMQILRDHGLRVALDDFGAGFSSLSHVSRLPLDKLKIDRCFTRDIETSPRSRKVVRLLASLCRELDMECIVEGVETTAQLDLLRGLGCRMIQGYLYGRPMREAQMTDYLEATPTTRVARSPANVLS